MLETFDEALSEHIAAIQARDIKRFAATLSRSDGLQVVGPDGTAIRGYDDVLQAHSDWFCSGSEWSFEPEIAWKHEASDMAAVLLDVVYTEEGRRKTFLLLTIFRREPDGWRFLYDQNTAKE
jgi:ketosteroid isomerase-like protein